MPNMKGQEVRIDVTSATQGVEPGMAGVIRSFEHQADVEGLSEGYLGGLTEEKDNVYTGTSGSLSMHLRSADAFSLRDRIKFAAQNRTPGETFQIVATYVFPIGGTKRVVIPDVKFSNLKVNVASRKDYAEFTADFAGDDYTTLSLPA